MSNLLKTELYKLFHSWYFGGIGIFNLLLSSILLLDSKERSSNLIMASLYNIPLLYFLSIVFIALFIGSDFSGRTLNTYITAGHKRSSIFELSITSVKTISSFDKTVLYFHSHLQYQIQIHQP